jgi:hypothetical protein
MQAEKIVLGVFLVLLMFGAVLLRAQDQGAVLSGSVSDASGKAVAGARVAFRSAATGQSAEAQTDSAGVYSVSGLVPGDYEITVSAAGLETKTAKATLAAQAAQKLDVVLAAPQANLPDAPSASRPAPSLDDLGFSPAETKSNAAQQALLDKRTHMLKIHQRMGLITTIPLMATLITSVNAGGKNTSTASRDLHTALGAVTADLYCITAYYAIRAPRVAGTETKGPIRLHRALAWIHGPGMILTPILGIMAFDQKNKGEKVHGLAAAHGPVAIVTAGAFGAALLSVSVKF